MYEACNKVAAPPFLAPWAIPVETRLAKLLPGSRKVIYFYTHPDNSTFRYRVYNVVQALEKFPMCGITATWFSHLELSEASRFLDCADALVLCRVRYCAAVDSLIGLARSRGVRVLFDCDDLVFDVKYVHMIMDSLNYKADDWEGIDYWYAYVSRLQRTLHACDGAITTNAFLAERATDASGLPAFIIPNFLNEEQIVFSEVLYEKKTRSNWRRDGRLHIGYFSGSPSHERDFAIVSDALVEIMRKHSHVHLRIAGYLTEKPAFAAFSDRVEVLPFTDFVGLQKYQAEVELAIAPLQSNIFTRSKSELKYFEAAVVGTASVVSPSFAFTQAILDGENGWIAPAQDWYNILDMLATQPALLNSVAKSARTHVCQEYLPGRQVDRIVTALFPADQ